MFSEDDLLPISALQHLAFCPRQWGLIHLEQYWVENRLTAEGQVLHERVHEAENESRGDLRLVRGLRLHSLRLGLSGVADMVEFHRDEMGVHVPGLAGTWRPVPIEYKRGKPKRDRCDEVQLCAQALCLEEMLGTDIAEGALFYGQPRRRTAIAFDADLRNYTEQLAAELHRLQGIGQTPSAHYEKKCRSCSMLDHCLPKVTGINKHVDHYLSKALDELQE